MYVCMYVCMYEFMYTLVFLFSGICCCVVMGWTGHMHMRPRLKETCMHACIMQHTHPPCLHKRRKRPSRAMGLRQQRGNGWRRGGSCLIRFTQVESPVVFFFGGGGGCLSSEVGVYTYYITTQGCLSSEGVSKSTNHTAVESNTRASSSLNQSTPLPHVCM